MEAQRHFHREGSGARAQLTLNVKPESESDPLLSSIMIVAAGALRDEVPRAVPAPPPAVFEVDLARFARVLVGWTGVLSSSSSSMSMMAPLRVLEVSLAEPASSESATTRFALPLFAFDLEPPADSAVFLPFAPPFAPP